MQTTLVSACSGDVRHIQHPRASSTSFVRRLRQPLRGVTHMRLVSAVIPNSAYNVQGGSLTVRLGAQSWSATVPRGRYDCPASLLTALQTAMARIDSLREWPRIKVELRSDGRLRFSTSQAGFSVELGEGLRGSCGALPGAHALAAEPSSGEYSFVPSGLCRPGADLSRLFVVRVREARGEVAHFPRSHHDTITYHRPASQQDLALDPPAECIRALSVDVLDEHGREWDLNNLDVSLLFEIRCGQGQRRKKSDRQ